MGGGLFNRSGREEFGSLRERPAEDDRCDRERGRIAGGFVSSAPDEGKCQNACNDRGDQRRKSGAADETREKPMRIAVELGKSCDGDGPGDKTARKRSLSETLLEVIVLAASCVGSEKDGRGVRRRSRPRGLRSESKSD